MIYIAMSFSASAANAGTDYNCMRSCTGRYQYQFCLSKCSWDDNAGSGGVQQQPQTYQQPPSLGEILYQAGQEHLRNQQAQQELDMKQAQQLQMERSQVNPILLPLVASNTAVSSETQGIILLTLQRSLEMDSDGTVTTWRNANTGSSGDIRVYAESKNRFGDVCRDFDVSLYSPGDRQTRSISGTGCRSSGRWNLMSRSQETRSSSATSKLSSPPSSSQVSGVTKTSEPPVSSTTAKSAMTRKTGESCFYDYDCIYGHACSQGICVAPKGQIRLR